MAIPLIRALRVSRPDLEITVVSKAAFLPLVQLARVADNVRVLPARGMGYFFNFWKLRVLRPDEYVLLTNSARGDIEAFLTGAAVRAGIVRPKRGKRLMLTSAYTVPADFDEQAHHQIELWQRLFELVGLRHAPVCLPVSNSETRSAKMCAPVFGFIAGSENNPEKRWPVGHWQALLAVLLKEFPSGEFRFFGTAKDRAITEQIESAFTGTEAFSKRIQNVAGRTDLEAYMKQLRECDLLIANDTGGMHLANALGVSLIALFGPTNPIRTGPVFDAPFRILQPPHCPPMGGASLDTLSPELVAETVRDVMRNANVGS